MGVMGGGGQEASFLHHSPNILVCPSYESQGGGIYAHTWACTKKATYAVPGSVMKHSSGKIINFQGNYLLSGYVGLFNLLDPFEKLMKVVDILTRRKGEYSKCYLQLWRCP